MQFRDTLRIGYTADRKRVTFHRSSSLFFFEKKEGSDEFVPPGQDRYNMLIAAEELGDASDVEGEKIKLGYLYSVDKDFLELHPFLLMHPLTLTKNLMAIRPVIDRKGKEFLLEGFPSEYKKTLFYGNDFSVAMERLLEFHLPFPSPFRVIKPSEQHASKFLESLKSIQEVKAF